MRPPLRLAVLGALLAVSAVACKKEKVALDAMGANPNPTADVLLLLELPRGNDAAAVAELVKKVQPGLGSMVGTQFASLVGGYIGELLENPDAIDLSRPIVFVLVDETKFPSLSVVIAHVASGKTPKAKEKPRMVEMAGDVALIGEPAAIAAIKPFALAIAKAPPAAPRLRAFPREIVRVYKDKIEEARRAAEAHHPGDPSKARLLAANLALMLEAGDVAEEVSLELVDGRTVRLQVRAREKSSLARFCALQKPSDFSLLGHLPPMPAAVGVMVGELHGGSLVEKLQSLLLPDTHEETDADRAFKGLLDGRVALAFNRTPDRGAAGPVSGVRLSGITDRARSNAAFATRSVEAAARKPLEIGNITNRVAFREKARVHADTDIHELTTTVTARLEGADATEVEMLAQHAATRDVWIERDGAEDVPSIEQAIDAAIGAGPLYTLPPRWQPALDAARAHKASLFVMLDFSRLSERFAGALAAELSASCPVMRLDLTVYPR